MFVIDATNIQGFLDGGKVQISEDAFFDEVKRRAAEKHRDNVRKCAREYMARRRAKAKGIEVAPPRPVGRPRKTETPTS